MYEDEKIFADLELWDERHLKHHIERMVDPLGRGRRIYSFWTIGITDKSRALGHMGTRDYAIASSRARREHGYPKRWFIWKTRGFNEAYNIVNYFIGKGMKSAGRVKDSPTLIYVYIFSR